MASPEELLRDVGVSNDLIQNDLIKLRSTHALVMEQLEEGYVHFDGQLQVTAANPTCQSLLGQSPSELVGKGPADLLSGVGASLWMSVLQRVLRTRKCEAFEAPFMGSHLGFKVFPLAEGVATLFDNVTELRTLAARLEVSTALEAAVVSHPDVASFILDPRGRLDTVSDTFCAATGFDADQLLKTKLVDIVAAPYRRAAVDAVEQTLASRNTSTLDVVILKKTTEELLTTLTIAAAVLGDVRQPLSWCRPF